MPRVPGKLLARAVGQSVTLCHVKSGPRDRKHIIDAPPGVMTCAVGVGVVYELINSPHRSEETIEGRSPLGWIARCTTKRAPDRHHPRSGALLGLLEEADSYACVASGASVAAVLAARGLLPPLNTK
jgi:hypothetical protein